MLLSSTVPNIAPSIPLAGGFALAVLALLLIWLGVYPTPLQDLIQATVGRLV